MDFNGIVGRLKAVQAPGILRTLDPGDAARPDPNAPVETKAHAPAPAAKPAAPAAGAVVAAPAASAAAPKPPAPPAPAAGPAAGAPAAAPKPAAAHAPAAPVQAFGDHHLYVDAKQLVGICRVLRDDAQLQFNILVSISGCDYAKEAANFGIVYHLISTVHKHRFTIRVDVPKANAEVDTVDTIWPAANWHERETAEFYGINFKGSSDLRKLLLADDWVGYPMRKDYVYPTEYHGISCV